MTVSNAIGFTCPGGGETLVPADDGSALIAASGARYPIVDGIPDFVGDDAEQPSGAAHQDYYRQRAEEYDRGNAVMFRMLLCDETTERNAIIDELHLSPGARVLETSCGTCRDTVHLLERGAQVYAGDLSREMLTIGRRSLAEKGCDTSRVTMFRADAIKLPFADGVFDASFHFGGLNLFPDPAAALVEMARVVRPGGRVVAGDEGVAPWLGKTDFAKILKNSNPLFEHSAPLAIVPAFARNVQCRWVMNSAFYLLSFDVGKGDPQLDLDVVFPGWRGGSHRSRYYGKLEGVSPQLRQLVIDKAAAEGMSIASWLEKTLGEAVKS